MLPAHAPGELSPLTPQRAGEPLGIVAGGGTLPLAVADAAAVAGWRPEVVTVADGVRESWNRHEPTPFRWGQAGDIFSYFPAKGVRHVVFCGTITVRPDFRSILPTRRTLAILPEILRSTRGGEDALLRAVGTMFERRGLRLHGVHEFLPDLLTPAGSLTARRPTDRDRAALDRALDAARRLGEADIGQAVVASAERVIALEAAEGTRDMLARVADLRARRRIGRSERCVLVKSVKPGQDHRFDLPSIGVHTVRQAVEAGLAGIGLTAGSSLLIGVADIVVAADAAGLFVEGLEGSAP